MYLHGRLFALMLGLGGLMFATLMILGQDRGQTRMGLSGAYALQADLPKTLRASQPAVVAVQPEPAYYMPAQPVVLQPEPAVAPAPAVARIAAPAVAQAVVPAERVMRVAADAVNVRQGPSTGDAVVGRLLRDDEVLVVSDIYGDWIHVRVEGDGVDGYVAARFLEASKD